MQPSIRGINIFTQYKSVIAATHSFKLTVFLQNKNCRKEILKLIMIPRCFQACIYWKKSVIWPRHFQSSIFSVMVLLFHGSSWSNPHVKERVYFTTLVATIHYNKRSVLDSRKIEKENQCSPALLKVPIYSTELVAIIFVWKELC